jgi:hypothetical protein
MIIKGTMKYKERIKLITLFYGGTPLFLLVSIFLKVWSIDSFKLSDRVTVTSIVFSLLAILLSVILFNVRNNQLVNPLTNFRVILSFIEIVIAGILLVINTIFSFVEQVSQTSALILIISLSFFAISCVIFLDFIKKFFYQKKIVVEKKPKKVKKIKLKKEKKIDLLKQFPVNFKKEKASEEIIIENLEKGEMI